ncbi:MAG: hypothetical protein AMS21_00595 [Gemmatimonas sp. SG8_38_2]|nr:MAG: hypothetical protein AMS21_00595 [Gemmatimonas sp. SG8_38_2]
MTSSHEDGSAATIRRKPPLAAATKAGGAVSSSVVGPSMTTRTRVGKDTVVSSSVASKLPSVTGYSNVRTGPSPSWISIPSVVASVSAAGLPFSPSTMRASKTNCATSSSQARAEKSKMPMSKNRRITA